MSEQLPLERFIEMTGCALPTLCAARELSGVRLAERRGIVSELRHDQDAAIVLLGSWGRHEVTSGSDDDYLVLVDGERRTEVRPTVDDVTARLERDRGGSRGPGRERTFGKVVFSRDLLDKVGLDRDTNSNLTQRSLLMLESEWISGQEVHDRARRAVIESYLDDTIKDFRPPRFLLNDLVRYWRTIGVDFVAKVRTRKGQGWGLRNAKLRTSRKLLFASGLLPVLTCHEHRASAMAGYLIHQFGMTPADRLAEAFMRYDALDHGVSTLESYDRFLALLDNADARSELNAITSGPQAADSGTFDEVVELGALIDRGLLGLLFSPALGRWTREFSIL